MRRGRRKGFNLSAEDARRALQMLVSEGKVAARDVVKAIERRQKLIAEIRERLAALGEGGAAFVSRAAKKGRPILARVAKQASRAGRRGSRQAMKAGRRGARVAVKAGRRGAKRALSAATRAKYQAQGRYMAAVRSLPKTVRKQIRQIRAKSGVDAAVKAAKAMGKKIPVMRHSREG